MAGQPPSIGEHAIRNPGAGDPCRPMARARTLPLPRVPPADHCGVAVDLRRRHVRCRAGPSGDRARQQSRVVVDRDDLLGRGLRRIRLGRRDHRGPDQTAHDHHLHRVRQRDRRIDHRGAGTGRCAAGLASRGRLSGDGSRSGVLLPRVQRDSSQDPARRATARSQRRRRCCAPGVSARHRSRGRRDRGGRDVPRAGRHHRGGVVRRRPDAARGNAVVVESPCCRA